MRSCGGGPVGGAANKRCNAGAGDVFSDSEGCGLAILTFSGKAPHITAGSKTGSSSVIGMYGDFATSSSQSDRLSKSRDISVSIEDCSHDKSVS